MSDNAYTHGLNYELIKRAACGEKKALDEILRIYDPFLDSFVIREVPGPDGQIHKNVDEDKKVLIQMHLIKVIQEKWRELI